VNLRGHAVRDLEIINVSRDHGAGADYAITSHPFSGKHRCRHTDQRTVANAGSSASSAVRGHMGKTANFDIVLEDRGSIDDRALAHAALRV
jgi:hypothetical protein